MTDTLWEAVLRVETELRRQEYAVDELRGVIRDLVEAAVDLSQHGDTEQGPCWCDEYPEPGREHQAHCITMCERIRRARKTVAT